MIHQVYGPFKWHTSFTTSKADFIITIIITMRKANWGFSFGSKITDKNCISLVFALAFFPCVPWHLALLPLKSSKCGLMWKEVALYIALRFSALQIHSSINSVLLRVLSFKWTIEQTILSSYCVLVHKNTAYCIAQWKIKGINLNCCPLILG